MFMLRSAVSLASALAVALTVLPSAAAEEARYRVHDLGTLGGDASFALDVNRHRQVSGNARTATSVLPLFGFLWEDGAMVGLGALPGSNDFSRAFGINDDGVIVGESDNDAPRAFRWEQGELTELATLGGASAVAHGINRRGHIAGIASNGTSSRPVLWIDEEPHDLGTLDGAGDSSGRAWALNDRRDVVGLSRAIPETFTSQATHWRVDRRGRVRSIANLGSLGDGDLFSEAFAVADTGWIVGRSLTPDGTERAVLWRRGRIRDLGALGFRNSRAMDVNARGQIVGHVSGFLGFPSIDGRAFVWQRGEMVDLNTLIPADAGWILRSAEGINEEGDIVGFGTYEGQTRAFLLTPTDCR